MLLYYYKPLFRPRSVEYVTPEPVPPKPKRRKKVYEIVGTQGTSTARDSLTEDVTKWREIRERAKRDLREIRERISDLSRREEAERKLEIRLAREAKKIQALEAAKANLKRDSELRRLERAKRQGKEIIMLAALIQDELLKKTIGAMQALRAKPLAAVAAPSFSGDRKARQERDFLMLVELASD